MSLKLSKHNAYSLAKSHKRLLIVASHRGFSSRLLIVASHRGFSSRLRSRFCGLAVWTSRPFCFLCFFLFACRLKKKRAVLFSRPLVSVGPLLCRLPIYAENGGVLAFFWQKKVTPDATLNFRVDFEGKHSYLFGRSQKSSTLLFSLRAFSMRHKTDSTHKKIKAGPTLSLGLLSRVVAAASEQKHSPELV